MPVSIKAFHLCLGPGNGSVMDLVLPVYLHMVWAKTIDFVVFITGDRIKKFGNDLDNHGLRSSHIQPLVQGTLLNQQASREFVKQQQDKE